ncbi:MAG: alpha/beta hydrolase-fold protein [Acidobacteriaceae bacterium]
MPDVSTKGQYARPDSGTARHKVRFAALVLLSIFLFSLQGVAVHWIAVQGNPSMAVGQPVVDANGVRYYPVRSIHEGSQEQTIRVLEPTDPAPGEPRRFLYVLPVDARVDTLKSTWGDGLEELRVMNVPNRYNMTLIAPSFDYEPWYGDNVNDEARRMESFIVDDVVPFGDSFARNGEKPQRLLVGFSKSGNGVLFLILRHPEIFAAAAAFDCPAEVRSLSAYSALQMNFGTQENYERYNIPSLISTHGDGLRSRNRLWISGEHGIFSADMIRLNHQLTEASIPHTWVPGGLWAHRWDGAWLGEAVAGLDADTRGTTRADNAVSAAPLTGRPVESQAGSLE